MTDPLTIADAILHGGQYEPDQNMTTLQAASELLSVNSFLQKLQKSQPKARALLPLASPFARLGIQKPDLSFENFYRGIMGQQRSEIPGVHSSRALPSIGGMPGQPPAILAQISRQMHGPGDLTSWNATRKALGLADPRGEEGDRGQE